MPYTSDQLSAQILGMWSRDTAKAGLRPLTDAGVKDMLQALTDAIAAAIVAAATEGVYTAVEYWFDEALGAGVSGTVFVLSCEPVEGSVSLYMNGVFVEDAVVSGVKVTLPTSKPVDATLRARYQTLERP